MKSRQTAMSMWRAAGNDTNLEPRYVYDEERDNSYRLKLPRASMMRYATKMMRTLR